MSSVPPSPALTHRSGHLQLYLCGCSKSMHCGLGGRRYYRGDCENRHWHFTRARPLFVRASEGRLAVLRWGHLAQQQGVPYLLSTRMRMCVVDKYTPCENMQGHFTNVFAYFTLACMWKYQKKCTYITKQSHTIGTSAYVWHSFPICPNEKKSVCSLLAASDMPTLISEGDFTNCILAHK